MPNEDKLPAAVASPQPCERTPGPWMVEPINDGETFQVTDCLTTGFTVICETLGGHEVDAANAHLISAAPGLLAFVKRQFDATVCICGFKAAGYTEMPCTRCDAQALISKAEGRVPQGTVATVPPQADNRTSKDSQ